MEREVQEGAFLLCIPFVCSCNHAVRVRVTELEGIGKRVIWVYKCTINLSWGIMQCKVELAACVFFFPFPFMHVYFLKCSSMHWLHFCTQIIVSQTFMLSADIPLLSYLQIVMLESCDDQHMLTEVLASLCRAACLGGHLSTTPLSLRSTNGMG